MRNSFNNISDKLKQHSNLFKCHRSFIVNLNKVIKIEGNSQ
ncbi:LytTR family transcriptional regulator DNA-binding domain-containing protein [Lutibacter profundi]